MLARSSNGPRGTLVNLAKVTMKMNIGHSHTAGIFEGVYQAGMNGRLDQGYNHGPSSWTHTDGIVYASGKRCLMTKRGSQ